MWFSDVNIYALFCSIKLQLKFLLHNTSNVQIPLLSVSIECEHRKSAVREKLVGFNLTCNYVYCSLVVFILCNRFTVNIRVNQCMYVC